MLASSLARTPERATVYALLAWVIGAALHDFALIGALLRYRLSPGAVFALAGANPVEAARVALLSGVDPELGVLGHSTIALTMPRSYAQMARRGQGPSSSADEAVA